MWTWLRAWWMRLVGSDAERLPAVVAPPPDPPRVVRATFSMVASDDPSVASRLEAAMVDAVLDCQRRGVTDPSKIRIAQLAARDRAKAEIDAGA